MAATIALTSALMIHSTPDNYANIPERYAEGGPDEVRRHPEVVRAYLGEEPEEVLAG